MKQIGMGMMQYVQDYDERYPLKDIRFNTGPSDFISFRQAVQPYIKSGQLFSCPSNPQNEKVAAGSTAKNGHPAINISYHIIGSGTIAYSGIWRSGNIAIGMAEIPSPTQVIAVAESLYDGTDLDVFHGNAGINQSMFAGHLGMSNYLFVDGHVKAMRITQTLPECNPNPTPCGNSRVNMWTRANENPSVGFYNNLKNNFGVVDAKYNK